MDITISNDAREGLLDYIEAVKMHTEYAQKLENGSNSISDMEARDQAALYMADAADRVAGELCKAVEEAGQPLEER